MHAKVEHYALVEALNGRFTATWQGQELARANLILQLTETYQGRSLEPVWYFRPADVNHDLLEICGGSSQCPIKGIASYWDLVMGRERARAAVWSYQRPLPMARAIRGCFAFDTGQGVTLAQD